MDTSSLKSEFEGQMKDIEVKISKAKDELAKMEEYKLKLIGGLETLALLENKEEEQTETDNND
jgi:hypothetical protein